MPDFTVPEEILRLGRIYAPYLVGRHLEKAPPEALAAFEKVQDWLWQRPA